MSSTYSIVDDPLHGHEDLEAVRHDVLGLAVVNFSSVLSCRRLDMNVMHVDPSVQLSLAIAGMAT